MITLLQAEKRIVLISALLVLLTGVLVSAAASLPLYSYVRAQVEEISAANAGARQTSIESQLGGYRSIAILFASRTEIRRHMEIWSRGEASLQSLQEYSRPRLEEAARQIRQLAALYRIDNNGQSIAAVGELAAELTGIEHEPSGLGLILPAPDAPPLLRTSAPILADNGELLGHDILYFHLDDQVHHLRGFSNYGAKAEVFLYNRNSNLTLGLSRDKDHPQPVLFQGDLQEQLQNMAMDKPGIGRAANDRRMVLIQQPFKDIPVSLVIRVPEKIFYAPAYQDLIWVYLLILALLILAVLASRAAIKPLLGLLTHQARQIEDSHSELLLAASVFENTGSAILITDTSLNILRANPTMLELCGQSQQELAGQPLTSCTLLRNQPLLQDKDFRQRLKSSGQWQGEIRHARTPGPVPHVSLLRVSTVRNRLRQPLYHIFMFDDISSHKAAEQRIRRLAERDALTGLLNRASMLKLIQQTIDRQQRFAVLFVDLDKFKPVNDQHGHQTGDQILLLVAERLRNAARGTDSIARFGGDEFLILLKTPNGRDFIERITNAIIHQLQQPFEINGQQVIIGVSIGLAQYPEHGQTADAIIHAADLAMYNAKRQGGNLCVAANGVNQP